MTAGRHARIYSSIWQDEDFLALRAGAQRFYMFLLSQSNMSHLGVLPLTAKRWARGAVDYGPMCLQDDLAELAERRYVVVDHDTEELLVRTLLRNDKVYKQPNTLRAAEKSAAGVASRAIRQVLVSEIDSIDLSDIEEGKRENAATGLRELRETLGGVPWNPSPGVPSNAGEPLTRARARARRARPLPPPPPPSPSIGEAQTLDGMEMAESPGQRANRLTRIYTEQVPLSKFIAVQQVVTAACRTGHTNEQITDGLNRLVVENRAVTIDSLRIAMNGGARKTTLRQSVDSAEDHDAGWGDTA